MLPSSHASARREASYSTGKVTMLNKADIPIIAIPIQKSTIECETLAMMIPR